MIGMSDFSWLEGLKVGDKVIIDPGMRNRRACKKIGTVNRILSTQIEVNTGEQFLKFRKTNGTRVGEDNSYEKERESPLTLVVG